MYCQDCGTELSDEANFCSKCGKPQKPDVSSPSATAAYEICQTGYDIPKVSLFGASDAVFVAIATSPKKGRYTAARSPIFRTKTFARKYGESPIADFNGSKRFETERQAALDSLIQQLLADGWEPTGQSELFSYQQTFRRIVK